MPVVERAPAPPTDDAHMWMSADQAARRLQVSVRTIRRRCHDGSLPFTHEKVGHLWRIWRTDVERHLQTASPDGTRALLDGKAS